jgi:hypothetical protein
MLQVSRVFCITAKMRADVADGSKTVLTPLKWEVCIPPESRLADCDIIICGGGAKPTGNHLASTVHCVDEEIIGWLRRRERRRRDKTASAGPKTASPVSLSLHGEPP